MGQTTGISWTDHTFNPWWGCTKVHAGCTNCYAEVQAERFGKDVWGKDKERFLTSDNNWNNPIRWNKQAGKEGVRKRVFCSSMADVFDAEIPIIWRERLWDLINKCPNLDWQILTKRPENIYLMTPLRWFDETPKNILFGSSPCDQKTFEKEVKPLVELSDYFRIFLSLEPLLEEIDITAWVDYFSWVIVGGESGNKARPCKLEWIESIVRQCKSFNVPCFVKQTGVILAKELHLEQKKGDDVSEFPIQIQLQEFYA